MRLYVPSLGDQLRLTAPWEFNLVKEHRNESLWKLMRCDQRAITTGAAERAELQRRRDELSDKRVAKMVEETYTDWPSRIVRTRLRQTSVWADPADKELYEQLTQEWFATDVETTCEVTLPVDTVLKVDRIYIRKGAEGFDSMSFYASIPGYNTAPKSKKKVGLNGRCRFWARLADCNKIEFEVADVQ